MNLSCLPAPVAELVTWWWSRVSDVLGSQTRSVLAYGSVTLGDFSPAWSDVDLCVAVDPELGPRQAQQIAAIHTEMGSQFLDARSAGWESGQAVEAVYISPEGLSQAQPPARHYFGHERGGEWETPGGIPAFDQLLLDRHGCVLTGESLHIHSPDTAALVKQTREELAWLEPDRSAVESAIWMAGVFHWLARAIAYWRDGEILSKSAALRREIGLGSPLSSAYSLALELRIAGSRQAAGRRDELSRHFRQQAGGARDEIARLLPA
ncbi:hypothetical protein ACFL6X_00325 [Candidatus Latescibacterota bacterium]